MKLEAVKSRAKRGLVNKYPQKKEAAKPAKSLLLFAPAVAIEPTSNWLKVNYSTAELRRSFITNAARKISTVGGSFGNVQLFGLTLIISTIQGNMGNWNRYKCSNPQQYKAQSRKYR